MTHAGHRAYKKVVQRNRPCDLQKESLLFFLFLKLSTFYVVSLVNQVVAIGTK